jgi:hypothetical protein
MLSIWSGNTVIDRLHLHDSTPNGFAVIASPGGSSVDIIAMSDSGTLPAGRVSGGLLPLHHAMA